MACRYQSPYNFVEVERTGVRAKFMDDNLDTISEI